jgi:rhamnulokinase
MHRAVAIDLGATSGRLAYGEWRSGRIFFEIVEQVQHEPISRNGRLEWDIDTLLSLCKRGVDLALHRKAESIGIDSWGVDHGFLDSSGRLIATPVCYRDTSHISAFESLAPNRRRLYELTGIQHQPFNTICQLVARKKEDPELPKRAEHMLILPDLLGHLLGGGINQELTQASTTQLLGLDQSWCEEAFELAGWPVPATQPKQPGNLGREIGVGIGEAPPVRLAHVGSHDTASAVAGFGTLRQDQIFLNVGTWSLAGCLVDRPIVTPEAESSGYTNERAVDGRVRFLKNIPGFYFINRLHKELAIGDTVPEWLRHAQAPVQVVDLLDPAFFNPDSMIETCRGLCDMLPASEETWAGFALHSLAAAVCSTVEELRTLTGRTFCSFRVGGGGSQSEAFCETLATRSGLEVLAGPVEATVLGNLGGQFLALGACAHWKEVYEAIDRSTEIRGVGR